MTFLARVGKKKWIRFWGDLGLNPAICCILCQMTEKTFRQWYNHALLQLYLPAAIPPVTDGLGSERHPASACHW